MILELSAIAVLSAAALRTYVRRLRAEPFVARDGFRWARRSLLFGERIEGFAGGLSIEVRLPAFSIDQAVVRLELAGLVPSNMLVIGVEEAEARDLEQGRSVSSGHADFDGCHFVSGPEVEVLARLTADARRVLLSFPTARIANSALEVEVSLRADAGLTISRVLELARELAPVAGTPLDRLAERVKTDRFAGARLRALEVLVARFPNTQETRATAQGALLDEDLNLRLLAAMFLGEEGDPIVTEIAMTAAPALRAKAIKHVGRSFPWEKARPIIEVGIKETGIVLSAAVLAWATHGAARPSSERTSIRLELESLFVIHWSQVGVDLIEAMAILGDEASESFLLERLEGESIFRVAAALSLAKVGTPAAIPGLARAATSPNPSVAKAARTALQAVRRRLGVVDEGRLSVIDSRGEGSLAVAEDGQLELVGKADSASGPGVK